MCKIEMTLVDVHTIFVCGGGSDVVRGHCCCNCGRVEGDEKEHHGQGQGVTHLLLGGGRGYCVFSIGWLDVLDRVLVLDFGTSF